MLVDLVIGTTNTENLNAHHYFSHPSAVQRRFPFIIEPKPKPEYVRECGMLDSSKTNITGGGYPDYWTWTVKTVSPVSIHAQNKNATLTVIHDNVDLKTFLLWFNKAIHDFDRNQTKMVSSLEAMRNTQICTICELPNDMCICTLQSTDIKIDIVSIIISTILSHILALIYVFCIKSYFIKKYSWFFPSSISNRVKNLRRRYMLWYNQDIRKYFHDMGDFVREDIGYPLLFASLASLLACGLVINRLTKTATSSIQGANHSKPTPSSQDKLGRKTWYTDNYVLSTFDVSPQTTSMASMSLADINALMGRDCVHIETSLPKNSGVRIGKAVCLQGNLYITNNHNIPVIDDQTMLSITASNHSCNINGNFNMKLSSSQVTRYPDVDLCVIVVPNIPPKRGIFKFLPNKDFKAKFNGSLVKRNKDGSLTSSTIDCIMRVDNANIPQLSAVSNVWSGKIKQPTVDGDCGALLISQTAMGPVAVGIHIMGEDENVVSIALTREFFADVIAKHPLMCIQSSEPKISAIDHPRFIGPLHYKANIRFIDSGVADVYGSFDGFRGTHKSRVESSILKDYLINKGYKLKFGVPEMRSWEPWYLALSDLTKPNMHIDYGIVESVTKSFYDDITAGLTTEDYDMLHVYDDITTLNGAPGVNYVDKINRNTSAGSPWKKGKRYFMYAIPSIGELYDPVALDTNILDRIDVSIQTYINGERTCPIYTASLKDEPVTFAKISAKKTRVFSGAPLDFTFIVRKFLLSFVRLVQTRRELFESAPGIIAQSLEWNGLFYYITQHGEDRIVAGDYRKFDKTMAPVWIKAAFKIIIKIITDSGNYSEDDIKIVMGISADIAYPLMDFNGDLIQFFGSNPSGHPLTVIINGIANCLYMRYTYFVLNPMKESTSFKKNVALMTYGDDNICSINKACPWYNHTTISNCFATIGIGYTMADKEAVSVPYINIKDASFLKRRWEFNVDLDCYLAPLEHDSIEKMLLIWVASKTISPKHQAIAVVSSAIREYFFYGEDIFNEKRNLLIEMCDKLDLRYWVTETTFPTWPSLVEDFRKNSEHLLG
jgi:hypothetical protein